MRLICARHVATGRPVITPAGEILVPLGQMVPCPADCDGFVVHDLVGTNRAAATATFAAAAAATAKTTWEVDGSVELQDTLSVQITLPEDRLADRCKSVAPPLPVTALAPSQAAATVEGTVSADRLNTTAEAAALVRIKNLQLTAWSYAACALAPEVTATVSPWCRDKRDQAAVRRPTLRSSRSA